MDSNREKVWISSWKFYKIEFRYKVTSGMKLIRANGKVLPSYWDIGVASELQFISPFPSDNNKTEELKSRDVESFRPHRVFMPGELWTNKCTGRILSFPKSKIFCTILEEPAEVTFSLLNFGCLINGGSSRSSCKIINVGCWICVF